MLGGAGLTDGWFHHTSLGWGLTLSLCLFGKLSLLYHSYIVRGHMAIDKSRDKNKTHRDNYADYVHIWSELKTDFSRLTLNTNLKLVYRLKQHKITLNLNSCSCLQEVNHCSFSGFRSAEG